MATKIRLKRFGGKHDPHFRIVVADSRKKRDGSAVEELGYYCPAGSSKELEVNAERAQHWLDLGAQPTDTVRSLFVKAGVLADSAGEAVQEDEGETDAAQEAQPEDEVAEDAGEATDEAAETEETADEAPEDE